MVEKQPLLPKCHELKALMVSMKHPASGSKSDLTYEWVHMYQGLKPVVHQADFFDYLNPEFSANREKMQQSLLSQIQCERYDIVIFIFDFDRFDCDFIQSLSFVTKTFCFFMDDNWRKDFVKKWAPCFDAFSTAMVHGEQYYKALDLGHAIFFPFGVNEKLFFSDHDVKKNIDVSFVGAWHPYREWLINRLRKQGIAVEVFGYRWPGGSIPLEQMIDVFRRSKISLNLSNSVSLNMRYLLTSPRGLINAFRSKKRGEQIKGRHFEIPACGSLQLSNFVAGLNELFKFDSEIVVFNSPQELIKKVKFYLEHDAEREAVSQAGHRRTLQDHTYSKRFLEIFQRLNWCA